MSQNAAVSPDPKTILIVDDNPLNVGVVVDHLEHRGFDVAVALGGEEALERARFLGPDLILLDVMMPGMDGFETCRRLKAAAETSAIPVIFMTALGDVSDKVQGFEAGGVDYVRKPFQVGDLLARVNAHLALGATQKRLRSELRSMETEIDRQKQAAEAALAGPGARYRQIFELAEDGILLVECESETVTDANPAAAEMFGRPLPELIGRRLSELPAFGGAKAGAVQEVAKTHHAELGEWRIERREGVLAVEVTGTLRRGKTGELVELNLRPIDAPTD